MRRITINFAKRERKSALAPSFAAVLLIFTAFFSWHNIESFLENRSRLELLRERAAELEKSIPDEVRKNTASSRIDRKSLIEEIEFVNDYAYRKSFSWTGLLTSLEEGLPTDVRVVSISPEFKGSKVNVTGYTRSMDSALSTVDRLGRAGFTEVFLLRHARDEKSGLILFDISAVYRAS